MTKKLLVLLSIAALAHGYAADCGHAGLMIRPVTVTGAEPYTVDLGPQTVGGFAAFDVSAKRGEPLLTLEYACHPNGLTDNNAGWPGNLKAEVSDDNDHWTLLKEYTEFPRRETVIDAQTVVGTTRARYLRLSATQLGPAWLEHNYNLQFGKIAVHFE